MSAAHRQLVESNLRSGEHGARMVHGTARALRACGWGCARGYLEYYPLSARVSLSGRRGPRARHPTQTDNTGTTTLAGPHAIAHPKVEANRGSTAAGAATQCVGSSEFCFFCGG